MKNLLKILFILLVSSCAEDLNQIDENENTEELITEEPIINLEKETPYVFAKFSEDKFVRSMTSNKDFLFLCDLENGQENEYINNVYRIEIDKEAPKEIKLLFTTSLRIESMVANDDYLYLILEKDDGKKAIYKKDITRLNTEAIKVLDIPNPGNIRVGRLRIKNKNELYFMSDDESITFLPEGYMFPVSIYKVDLSIEFPKVEKIRSLKQDCSSTRLTAGTIVNNRMIMNNWHAQKIYIYDLGNNTESPDAIMSHHTQLSDIKPYNDKIYTLHGWGNTISILEPTDENYQYSMTNDLYNINKIGLYFTISNSIIYSYEKGEIRVIGSLEN